MPDLAAEIAGAILEGITAVEDAEVRNLSQAETTEIDSLVRRELPGHARRLAMLAARARLQRRGEGGG